MYLYSNIIGSFVFNQNFKIREKSLFPDSKAKEVFMALQKNEILEPEKRILKKFKNIKNLRAEADEKALSKIFIELESYKEEFYKKNLLLTKIQVREAFTEDLMIIQVSSLITELNKSINLLSRRLREIFGYILPELEKKISSHEKFAELIVNKGISELKKEFKIKDSMAPEISKETMGSAKSLAKTILGLLKEKKRKEQELERLMKKNCPNLKDVAGSLTGAKLIAIAGSLKNMVLMPASTIQLLGAEKALFRHMVKGSKSPKYGIIFEHPIIQKAKKKDRGKAARALADKILLAAKVDYFKGRYIADKLNKELKERFKEN